MGKLRVLEGIPVGLGGGSLVLKTNVPEPPEAAVKDDGWARTEAKVLAKFLRWFIAYRSPEGLARHLAERYYAVQIHADGTFRAVEVEPGTYTLSFWIGEDFKHPVATREVVVPPIPERRTDAPLDLGTVRIMPPDPKP